MANLNSKLNELEEQVNFRYLQNISQFSDEQLKEHDYYRGFVCPHGHRIRDNTYHWCYECVQKIKSNICGFDINYLDANYKHKYGSLWKGVEITHPEDCWQTKNLTGNVPKRVCMPSYRSFYSSQKAENITLHKAIYLCAWGDVGSLTVTRLCGNSACSNPLHMISSWNRGMPPQKVHPLDVAFKAEKLMLYARSLNEGLSMKQVVQQEYKNTITHPLEANDPPCYDEGG
jgi:hypothetical protein